ncbi:MAG: D-alanine--D-alanine ligase [Eubacteriales bacterium]|nr:D-alanine--D-alanine ligase [Eubacteriales bacterium]
MINVGVIFGGKSGEHEVSLQSAYNVITAIERSKYDVTLIGITREGRWSIYSGDVENIKNDTWEEDPANNWDFSFTSDEAFLRTDILFPVLHGTFGEDGTIQGLFEMLDKPYVGCGVLASSAAMDKDTAKRLFASVDIPVTDWVIFTRNEILDDTDRCAGISEEHFGYPVFVKPANMGSSVGISKAHDRRELLEALKEAALYDIKILVEKAVNAHEVEIAVIGNMDIDVSCPGMIVPCHEFYDYEAKYLTGDDSKIIIPAPIPDETAELIKDYAKKAFAVVCGTGLSRIDFLVSKDTGNIYLNEINTLPGFTNISMYSKLWAACGVSYPDLIERLIALGFERYNMRRELRYIK